MAEKTPVRVVFNESNVATGLAEFQSGDAVGVAFGGTGLNAIGSAGQVLKVNGAGTGLEFGAEGDISITNIVAPSNADLTFSTSGTGNIVLDAVTVRGTTFSAADSTKITFAESVDVTGTLTAGGLAYPTSDGSANQVLATDGSGTLSFISAASTGTLTFSGQTISGPSNADISIQPGGTGDVLLSALRVNGTTLDSSDSTKITIAENVDVTGTLSVASALSSSTSLALASGATVTGIADEDNMSSNSASLLATQQSIKAYVDGEVSGLSQTSISQGDSNVTVVDSGTGNVTIEVDGTDRLTTVAATTTTATGHSLVIGAGSTSAGGQIKFLEGTDNGTNGVTLIGPASTADVTVTLPAATDTLVGKATTDTFTNKTFDVEGTGNSISNIDVADFKAAAIITEGEGIGSNDNDTTLPTSAAVKDYVDTQITAEDLDITADDSTAIAIDLDSETLHFAGGNGISTSVSGNTVTTAIDSTVVTLAGSQTLTNKTLTTPVIASLQQASGSNTLTMPAATDTLVGRATTDTLTNKTLTAPTISTPTVTGTLTATSVTTNDIVSNGSNASINITPAGTGGVIITSGGVAFTLPTTDGSAGEFLKTDGAGTLSFGTSTTTPSDDTRVVIKNNKSVSTSARTIDYFQSSSADMAWYFVALNDLTNDRSSASCFTVAHNDSDAFVSGPRGGASDANNSLPSTTADISNSQVRVKITAPSDDSKISYYKIPISRANTSDATAGVTVTTSNTDVDSASETIDSFAHGTYRAAKYTILIDNNAKTETGVIEALVVHDGSTAYISQYGIVNTGNHDMVTLTAQIVSTNVVVSAAGLEPNLSLKIHKTLLSDSMSAVSNGNQKIIGATTISSSATAFDDFDLDDATAALYYVVGGNASEGHYSVYEVFCAGAPGEASVTPGTYVSTKGTTQLEFTAGFKSDADNSLQLSISSTSGASTVVNAYRINALAE